MFDPESFSPNQTLRISNSVLWEENEITRKLCVEEINKDKGEKKKNNSILENVTYSCIKFFIAL